jgi:hypothetical protein
MYYETYLLRSEEATKAGDRMFCVPMTLALLLDITVAEARKKLGVPTGRKCNGAKLIATLHHCGFKTTYIQGKRGRGMVRNMPNKLPYCTYLLFSNNHVTLMRDGVLLDWAADEANVNKRIKHTYMIHKQ